MKTSEQIHNCLAIAIISTILMLNPRIIFAEKAVAQLTVGSLNKVECEIMEVEELKEPKGGVIYTVKDLSSGSTIKLFADPYRSLIQMGGTKKQAADIFGGSKVTIIYQKLPDRDIPEIIFAKVISSYYS